MKMTFKAEQVEQPKPVQKKTFTPIPKGWYKATVKSVEPRNNKNGNGSHLLVVWEVISGEHQGRKLFDRFTLESVKRNNQGEIVPNEQAVQIGHRRLSEMSWALCHPQWDDTDELLGRQCKVLVFVRISEKYGDSNDVKAYEAIAPDASEVEHAAVAKQIEVYDDDDIPF